MTGPAIRGVLFALATLAACTARVDETTLRAAGAKAVAAVEEHLGVPLRANVLFRFTTPGELEGILDRELEAQFAAQFADEMTAERNRRAFAAAMARALLAKYDPETANVLVAKETLELWARLFDDSRVASAEFLQAMLVHEAVHAFGDQEYGFTARLQNLGSTDEILAYSAVIEGHAQFVARQVCEKNGWTRAFEVFTDSVGKTPGGYDYGTTMLMRQTAAAGSWAYYEGERFIASLHAARGEEGIRQAYLEPPESPLLVSHPEWYLDPTTRPKIEYDIPAAFDELERHVMDGHWDAVRRTLPNQELRQALALLPEADIDRFVASVRTCEICTIQWTDPPGERLVVAGVFVAASEAEATFVLAAEEALLRAKDERMRKGSIRIVEARYTPVDEGDVQGLHSFKTVEFRKRHVPVRAAVLRQGPLVLELMYSNHEIRQEDIVTLGKDLLARMVRQTEPK